MQDPIDALRLHVVDLLREAGCGGVPVALGPLMRCLGVRQVVEKKMVVEGALRRLASGAFDVWVRHDRPTVRKRFSIAHELGHLLFYRYAPKSKEKQLRSGQTAPAEEERLCNVAAAEILMPQEEVIRAIESAITVPTAVTTLARTCRTSISSALIRVAQELEAPGALQLWRRDDRTGWHVVLAHGSGGRKSGLRGLVVERWATRHAPEIVRMGHSSGTTHLFSKDRGTLPSVSWAASHVPARSSSPTIVLHYDLSQAGVSVLPTPIELYREHKRRELESLPPERSCNACFGTGWEYLGLTTGVRLCGCRSRAMSA